MTAIAAFFSILFSLGLSGEVTSTNREAKFLAKGWAPLDIGMGREDARKVLINARIEPREITLHKTGQRLLTFNRADGWKGDVYFDERQDVVNQITFTSPEMTEAAARAWIETVSQTYGTPAQMWKDGTLIWRNETAELRVSHTAHKNGMWVVFENFGRPHG